VSATGIVGLNKPLSSVKGYWFYTSAPVTSVLSPSRTSDVQRDRCPAPLMPNSTISWRGSQLWSGLTRSHQRT